MRGLIRTGLLFWLEPLQRLRMHPIAAGTADVHFCTACTLAGSRSEGESGFPARAPLAVSYLYACSAPVLN